MEDYPYNSDYNETSSRPAPRPQAKGEPPKLVWENPGENNKSYAEEMDGHDPYDDGLDPARGIINGLMMVAVGALTLYLAWKWLRG